MLEFSWIFYFSDGLTPHILLVINKFLSSCTHLTASPCDKITKTLHTQLRHNNCCLWLLSAVMMSQKMIWHEMAIKRHTWIDGKWHAVPWRGNLRGSRVAYIFVTILLHLICQSLIHTWISITIKIPKPAVLWIWKVNFFDYLWNFSHSAVNYYINFNLFCKAHKDYHSQSHLRRSISEIDF